MPAFCICANSCKPVLTAGFRVRPQVMHRSVLFHSVNPIYFPESYIFSRAGMIEALRHRIVTVTVILRFDRAARKEIEFNGVFIVLLL